jgi:hypothetical protein
VSTEPEKWKTLSIRTVPEFKALMTARAAREGMDTSVWAREVLAAVMAANVHLPDLARLLREVEGAEPPIPAPLHIKGQPGTKRRGKRVVGRAACLHPMHLRSQMVTFDLCRCGKQFDR